VKLEKIYNEIGVKNGHHILVHSSYRKIRDAFNIPITDFITSLKNVVSVKGSLIMPAFTYNFALALGTEEIFNRDKSPAKTGAVSECFRLMPDVVRTSSPTHSFSLWGEVTDFIGEDNSPISPLGKGSVLDWLANTSGTYIMLVGVDFHSLTFGHYLETAAPVPWADISPWDYMFVKKAGVSTNGIQRLREIPGCSKSFVNFENYLVTNRLIDAYVFNNCTIYYVSVSLLLEKGLQYFRDNYSELLCKDENCRPCCERRNKLNLY